jgi:UDP-glucose 4-epimerase
VRILVTGGAGFIGSHVVDRYVAAGHEVSVVDDLSTGQRARVNPQARFHELGIQSPELAQVFAQERPEAVSHQAAQADVRRSVDDPAHDARVNILGSINLLDCCRRFQVGRVIYASSGGAVYGDTDTIPTPEDHPARPASPYGISKLTVEYYLACWQALYGVRGLALRYANVYGPRQSPFGEAGVVAIFAHRLLRGEQAVINGDGRQTRDYVYVADVAEANLRALERPDVTGALNVGTGVETDVVALFALLRAAADVRAGARHGPVKPGEQRRSAVEPTRARESLGWRPRVDLAEGLRLTVEHLRQDDGGPRR